jgi:hypothetical protein
VGNGKRCQTLTQRNYRTMSTQDIMILLSVRLIQAADFTRKRVPGGSAILQTAIGGGVA